MQPNLKSIGILNAKDIKRYSLRQEGEQDILKIYFKKTGSELLTKSSKFKFQRHQKRVSGGHRGDNFTDLSEINPTLRCIIKELDTLALNSKNEKQIKEQLLDDLKHLESIVTHKIKEMEDKIEKL